MAPDPLSNMESSGREKLIGQNIYFHKNLPIQYLCLAGIVVSRDEKVRRTILVLDDSTGHTIEVVCSKYTPPPDQPLPPSRNGNGPDPSITHLTSATRVPLDISPLRPGVVAKLKGTITRFHGTLQLHLERYVLLHDTNAEVQFWQERTRYFVQVLSVPWVLSAEEVERLRREDVREEEEKRRKKQEREMSRHRRERKVVEREERDRMRIERRYEREEVLRRKYAERCREENRVFKEERGRR
ncbi:predicted protein [Uncinocarpus reesii 1704]|uniref:CST complex subunit Stn1 N-terminal domain-containing protein n=1 Tax=Uncinocarpus reesii (strain UAMH 1704) TaxID=336963 RepID=C4JV72_UNCRE|nr:uncharacterized protein UREG_06464 [Uncinocarpus reesii 1704]EEP81599.1 predicted protein [Uncinocarpus reesii 1704]